MAFDSIKKKQTDPLITDRNGSRFVLEQYLQQEDGVNLLTIVCHKPNGKDFDRLTFDACRYSAVWCSVRIERIKNDRRTYHDMEIDKKQIEFLIENLKKINDGLVY